MSGTFPISAGFQTLDFQSNTNSRVTRSVSGKTQRIKTGAQYWSFKLKSPAMTRAELMADYSFIVSQDGQVGSFTIVPPEVASTRGTMTGTMTVSTTVSTDPAMNTAAGSSAVGIVEDSTASGTLKKGDLIKFSNHDKVYMITEDFNLQNDSSVQPLKFYPPLTTAVTGSTTVTYTNVPIKVYLDRDEQKYITQADGTFQYEIVMNEEI
jgi:hypothetical protein